MLEQDQSNVDVQVEGHKEKIKALAVFKVIADEAENIEQNEVCFFRERAADVDAQINEISERLADKKFADDYFNV